MESLDEIDNITKNIVREIIRDCATAGVEISVDFCIYYVRLIMVDPQWKISPGCPLNRENVCRFINFCNANLTNTSLISIITLKLQHHFLKHVTNKNQIINIAREKLFECLEPLLQEIETYSEIETNFNAREKLFKKMIYFITLIDGLGDPSNANVFKEVTLALKSIMDPYEFQEFILMKRYERRVLIYFYKRIVTGIRLFNHNNIKTMTEISDLPTILENAMSISRNGIQEELIHIHNKINSITDIIENSYHIETSPNGEYNLVLQQNDIVTCEFLKNMKSLLIFCVMHKVCLQELMNELKTMNKYYKELLKKFNIIILNLTNTTKYRVAIPTDQIYPLFIDAADTWQKIQDEVIVLSTYNEVIKALHTMAKEPLITQTLQTINMYRSSLNTLTKKLTKGKIKSLKNCKLIERDKHFDYDLLEYLGYCVWFLVETEGCLVSGDTDLGIVKWNDKYYAFSSIEAAEMFDKNPERYVQQTLELSRAVPELTNLLDVYEQLVNVQEIDVLYVKPPEVILTTNERIQTDLHPIESHIDPDYMWNIWDLYRQAIKLANISKCLTHSSQTVKSYYRAGTRSQTFDLKHHNYQTKRDNYSNVPTLSNFIFGLRGRKDDVQHIIELTRPVRE